VLVGLFKVLLKLRQLFIGFSKLCLLPRLFTSSFT
jgi:hypothetical protein